MIFHNDRIGKVWTWPRQFWGLNFKIMKGMRSFVASCRCERRYTCRIDAHVICMVAWSYVRCIATTALNIFAHRKPSSNFIHFIAFSLIKITCPSQMGQLRHLYEAPDKNRMTIIQCSTFLTLASPLLTLAHPVST